MTGPMWLAIAVALLGIPASLTWGAYAASERAVRTGNYELGFAAFFTLSVWFLGVLPLAGGLGALAAAIAASP